MQPNHTPAHAQHVPAGWSFPTLSAPTPPPARVIGGGAAEMTVTRLRWGRLLPTVAGIALLAFGIWSLTANPGQAPGGARTVSGGGNVPTNEVDIAKAARAEAATEAAAATAPATTTPAAAPAARPAARRATPRAAARQARPARAGARRPARAARRAGAGAVAATSFAAPANAAPTTANGAGTSATGELPLTGIETWIAGILGVLLLGVGIVVHVNAVRLAATAMLYRRGILLRPVDCARMAQQRGLPQLRVLVSNALHRLLEEPASGDFVSARLAR